MDLRNRILTLDDKALRKLLTTFSNEEAEVLLHDWSIWGRANQQMPDPSGTWTTWMVLAGRGFGKTRTGSEVCKQQVDSGLIERIALVAPTAADARDVMVEGESGLISVFPSFQRPKYEPSKRRVTFHNGAIATLYSADEPERLRGPQHDFAWCDELGSWRYPEAYDMLNFGLRLGASRGVIPRKIVTTTPKPIPLVKKILKNPSTIVTRGSTFDNKNNLASSFLQEIINEYEGTRLGRQELYAEILDDNPGALWTRKMIEDARYPLVFGNPENSVDKQIHALLNKMRRIVVAVDPAVSRDETSDLTGIIVAGIDHKGNGYVFEDASVKETPLAWATLVAKLARKYGASRVVAEVNQGGDMVETILRTVDGSIPYKAVRASQGKFARAEPVSALYEKGRIFHVGNMTALEDQLCDYNPITATKSPDRLDALVWAFQELLLENNNTGILDWMSDQAQSVASNPDTEKQGKVLTEKEQKIRDIFKPKLKE